MKRNWFWFKQAVWLALLFVVSGGGLLANGDINYSSLQRRLSEVFRENALGVLRVKASVANSSAESNGVSLRVGTGFIISRDGHVLTNASVVQGAEQIWVEHKEISYSVEKIGYDVSTNVALLKLVDLPREFQILSLDPGTNAQSETAFLLAVTMPLEFDPTPSWGMLTGRESYFGNRFFPAIYIRSSIPAVPGAAGSPVFDLQGQFVGMIVAAIPDIQSSYILPARALIRVRDELLFSGSMQHAFLGVEIEEKTGIEIGRRVTVTDIMKDGPADLAGIRPGDIVEEFADRRIERFHDFVDAVFFVRPGQEVSVVLLRGEERITTSMKVLKREPQVQGEKPEEQKTE